MNNIFEKICLTLILLKIFDIYFYYFATNMKIAIAHLWHAMEPKTICHLIVKDKVDKFANLISKLNFYKLIPYPMDNSLSGRRRPARQTSEKDVLCFHRLAGP